TTAIYPLSLHDALPISSTATAVTLSSAPALSAAPTREGACGAAEARRRAISSSFRLFESPSLHSRNRSPAFKRPLTLSIRTEMRSEEHTSELQSLAYLV